MTTFSATAFEEALSAVPPQFQIDSLYPEQELVIKALLMGTGKVFVNLTTGYGKSLIF